MIKINPGCFSDLISWNIYLSAALAAFICSSLTFAEVKVYEAPKGIEVSTHYKIEIVQDLKSYYPPIYMTDAQLPKFNRSKSTSFSLVEFTGKIKVIVTKLDGGFKTCKAFPSSYNINVEKKDGSAIFELNEPRKIAIEFDGDIRDPLLLFADAPQKDVPDQKDPNVIYFGPGYHNVEGDVIAPKSGQTVYLAPGSVVNAFIRANNVHNVKIKGRGILYGRKFEHTGGRFIDFTGSQTDSILVEDIVILDAPGYYITTSGKNTIVRNVKGIGWWFNTDGISTGYDGLIEDCFLKCNDDAIKLYKSGTKVFRTTIWQMENGAPFQISWNTNNDNSGFVVKDCDVIHADHAWDNPNNAVFNAIHGGKGRLSNYLFENIRIENCDWRLFNILILPNVFAEKGELGEISDLVFKDIKASTPEGKPFKRIDVIQGYDANHMIKNVKFINFSKNGHFINNAKEGSLKSSKNTTRNISYEVTGKTDDNISVLKSESIGNGYFEWDNPVVNGLNSYGQKDFHIYTEAGKYYLTATEQANREWGERGIILYESDDLLRWHEKNYLINKNEVDPTVWYRDLNSSPEIHKIKGKYYLSFAARNNELTPYDRLGLCLAEADSVTGPYRIINREHPIVLGNNFNLFEDKDGTVYTYWDYMGRIYCAAIDLDNAKFRSEPQIILGPDQLKENYKFIDAPFVMNKDGQYYLIFSSFYTGYVVRVRYVTGKSPLGPWNYESNNPLMVFTEDEADTNYKMPYSSGYTFAPPTQVVFHNQVMKGPGGKYYIYYHSSEKYSEPYLTIEPLEFTDKRQINLPFNKVSHQKICIEEGK